MDTLCLPAAGMLAPDGRCKALDAAADGYVRSEAATALVLRCIDSLTAPASGARSSLDAASCALLLGSAVNQDGRSSSLTAPNGPSQQVLLRVALAAASLPAPRVNLLSMHGTGERLMLQRSWAGLLGRCGTSLSLTDKHALSTHRRNLAGRPDRGGRGCRGADAQAQR